MKSVGEKFEIVFNEYFNNQQKYKHKIELLKAINNDWSSQNLNNLFNNVSITQIMIEICKSLQINLNFLVGLENNKFLFEKENNMNELCLKKNLIYEPYSIKKTPILNISLVNDVLKFQTNSINFNFSKPKKCIAITKGGLVGIILIYQHYLKDNFFIKLDLVSNDFLTISKNDIEIIAEELINEY
jgi:hypothetical protein